MAIAIAKATELTMTDLFINKRLLFEFIKQTQSAAYDTIVKRGDEKFIKRLGEQIKSKLGI